LKQGPFLQRGGGFATFKLNLAGFPHHPCCCFGLIVDYDHHHLT
jgi:hypothetical protein